MSDYGDYPEATPEQKLAIATYFVMSSPVGEVNDVMKDVKVLVNDDSVLSDVKVESILKEYNTQQFVAAKAPNGEKVLLSYFCPVAGGFPPW